MMHPARRLNVDADLEVSLGAARLAVRGSGSTLDIHLPAPWYWPRLWRASASLRAMVKRHSALTSRGDVTIRACYGPLRFVLN